MTTEIEKAEQTLATLQAKRAARIKRGTDLADERAAVALDAHTGNAKAAKRLAEIHSAIATHGSELTSIDAAIAVAQRNVESAKAAEAAAEQKRIAEQARLIIDRADSLFASADKHLKLALEALKAADARIEELHARGFAFPTAIQVRTNALFAVQSSLMALPKYWWNELSHGGVRFLAPHERRSFQQFWSQMAGSLGREIAQRLGEVKQKEVA